MNVKKEQDPFLLDTEVLIRYAKMNPEVEQLILLLKTMDKKIKCIGTEGERYIQVSDIYYLESVDKQTFVYLEDHVYRTDYRLYQFLEQFSSAGFVQASKFCVLNINRLKHIKPLANSRMIATLINEERVFVTRKYLQDIKQALQKGVGL